MALKPKWEHMDLSFDTPHTQYTQCTHTQNVDIENCASNYGAGLLSIITTVVVKGGSFVNNVASGSGSLKPSGGELRTNGIKHC